MNWPKITFLATAGLGFLKLLQFDGKTLSLRALCQKRLWMAIFRPQKDAWLTEASNPKTTGRFFRVDRQNFGPLAWKKVEWAKNSLFSANIFILPDFDFIKNLVIFWRLVGFWAFFQDWSSTSILCFCLSSLALKFPQKRLVLV